MQQNQNGRIVRSSSIKRVKFKRELEETIFVRNQYKQYQGRAMFMTISKCLENKKFTGFMKLCINVRQFQQKRLIVKLVDMFIKKKYKADKNLALSKIRKKAFQFNYAIAMAKKLYFLQKNKNLQFKRLFFCKLQENIFRSQFRCKFPKYHTKTQLFRNQQRQPQISQKEAFSNSFRQSLTKSGYNSPAKILHGTHKIYSPIVKIFTQDQVFEGNRQKDKIRIVQFSNQQKQQFSKYMKYNKEKYWNYLTDSLRDIVSEQIKKVDRLKITYKMFKQKPKQDEILLRLLSNTIRLISQLNKQTDEYDERRSRDSSISNSIIIERSISASVHTGSMTNLQLMGSRNRGINKQPKQREFQTMKRNIRKQLQSNNTLYAKNQIKMFLKKYSNDDKFKEQLLVYQCLHNYMIDNQKANKCLDQSKKIVDKLSTVDLQKPLSANLQALKGVKRQCNLVMNKNVKNIEEDALSNKVYQIAKSHQKSAQDYIALLQKNNANQSFNSVRSRQASPVSILHKRTNSQVSIFQDSLPIKQLQKQLKQHKQSYGKCIVKIENLQQSIKNCKRQNSQNQHILRQRQQKITDLQAQLKIKSQTKLQNQNNEFKQKLQKQKQKSQEKQRAIRTLEHKNKEMSEKIKRIDNLFEKNKKQIYQLEQKQISLKEEILMIKIQLNRQRNEKEELQQQIENLVLKKDQQTICQSKQKRKIQQLNEKNKQIMETNDRLSQILDQERQLYLNLEVRYKQLEKAYQQKLNNQSNKFCEQIDFENSIFKQSFLNSSRTFDQTKRNTDEIVFENKYIAQQLQKQRRYIQQLKFENGELLKQVTNLRLKQQQKLESKSKLVSSTVGYSQQERQIMKNTLTQYSLLKDQQKMTEEHLQTAVNKIRKYEQQLRAQQIHAGKLIIQNHKIKDQLELIKSQFEKIKSLYAKISADFSEWRNQHQRIVEQQVRKALKIQQIQINEFLKQNDIERNAYFENIVIPQRKQEWEKAIQKWVDGIIKEQQRLWQLQFRTKYHIQQKN